MITKEWQRGTATYLRGDLFCCKGPHPVKVEDAKKQSNGRLQCPIHHCALRHKPRARVHRDFLRNRHE